MSVSLSSILFHRGNTAVLGESSLCSSQCPSRPSASKPQRLLNSVILDRLQCRREAGGCYCEKRNPSYDGE